MRLFILTSILLFQLFTTDAQPIAVCKNDTAYIGLTGWVFINAAQIDGGSTGATNYYINGQLVDTFYCYNIPTNNVMLTVTDSLGNVSFCTAVITIKDTIAPIVVTPFQMQFVLNSSGVFTAIPAMFTMGLIDNCNISNVTLSKYTFTCADLGPNTVVVTAMDQSGNLGSSVTIVNIRDTFASPTPALCRTDTLQLYLGVNDSTSITYPDIYTGNHSTICWTFSLDQDLFTIADVGFNTVQLIASSSSYNDTCTAVVQIIDTAVVEMRGHILYTTDTCQTGNPIPYLAVELQPAGLLSFTNSQGEYHFSIPATDTYTVILPYLPSLSAPLCPVVSQQTIIADSFGYYGNIDFMLGRIEHDISVNLVGGNYRIGFPSNRNIVINNQGVYSESGTITYITDNSVSISNFILDSYVNWLSTSGDTTYFSYNNLPAGAYSYIRFSASVATGTPLNTPIEDCAYINITGTTDANMSNNNDCNTRLVVNSYDPNEKTVEPFHSGNQYNGTILPTDEVLSYTIHFQNTGNAEAINVELRDTLSGYLLPNTMHNILSSHDCEIRVEQGNILIIRFEDIYLADSTSDYLGSMGFFHFSIHRNSSLPLGTIIENSASIYFDFNAPIITNKARSTIALPLYSPSIQEKHFNSWVAPNPVQNSLNLSYQLETETFVSVEIINTLGEVLSRPIQFEKQNIGEYSTIIPMQNLPAGLYFLRIMTNQEQKIHRIIKN